MISTIISTKLAEAIGAKHIGKEVLISGVNRPDLAKPGELFFLEKEFLNKISASSCIALVSTELKDKLPAHITTTIVVDNLRTSLPLLSKLLYPHQAKPASIHPSAVIDESATISDEAYIGANCVIEAGVKIASGVILEANCFIGTDVEIGEGTYISSNCSILFDTKIGNNCRIGSGAVIGYDGFGFANVNGVSEKLWHLSYVSIGNNVEIGANSCVDRGFVSPTIISDNTKIDNLVQIGHNVEIGASTILSGGILIGGSTKIGKNCLIGGGTDIADHLVIDDGVIVAGGSQLGGSLTKGIYGSFLSAKPLGEWKRIHSSLKHLPELIKNKTI